VRALVPMEPTVTPPSHLVTRELLSLPPSPLTRHTPEIRQVYTRQRKRKAEVIPNDRIMIEVLEKELEVMKKKSVETEKKLQEMSDMIQIRRIV